MRRPESSLLLLAAVLAGCGAEVAGTAATTAKLQTMQAEQAKAQQEQFKKQLGAAMQSVEAATSAAADK